MFANPVGGHIQARTEVWDKQGFIVTSTLDEHKASGRPLGTDFGDGRCGDTVYAMEAGLVSRWRDPGGALVIRIKHGNTGWSTGYAHLSTFLVQDQSTVKRGQPIGTVGKTGATACHLHADAQRLGVHADLWKLLDQNLGGDMKITITSYVGPRQCGIAAGATVEGWSDSALVKSQKFLTASSFRADADVVIDQTPNKPPEGLFRRALDGVFAGLYVPSPQVTLGPPATLYTQAQLDAAVDKAETDAAARAATAVAAASVTEAKKYG